MTPVRGVLAAACAIPLVAGAVVTWSVVRRGPAARAPRSTERSIGLLDPHLHLSVADVRVVDPPDGTSGTRLWIVTVRARSDAGRIDIDPSRLAIRAGAPDGRSFPARGRDGAGDVPFDTRLRATLRPGEAYDQSFLFELPVDARSPFLVLETDAGPLAWLPPAVRHLLGERVELSL